MCSVTFNYLCEPVCFCVNLSVRVFTDFVLEYSLVYISKSVVFHFFAAVLVVINY